MTLLFESAVKVSLILLFSLGALRGLRARSASVRHCVLAAGMLGAALAPLVALGAPAWHLALPWFPAQASIALAPSQLTLSSGSPAAASALATQPPAALDPTRVVWLAWMLGVAVNVIMLLAGIVHLTRLARRARPITDGTWAASLADIVRHGGREQKVRLLHSDHPTLLVTWGLSRSKIIVPAAAQEWPEDRIRVVLYHELAHIRRADWLVQILATLLRAAYWFNPLLWMACRRLRQESEQACDDAVLRAGVEGTDYAAHLLALARVFASQQRSWSAAPAIARASTLHRRVQAMLAARVNREPLSRRTTVAALGAIALVTVSVAGLSALPPAVVPPSPSRATPTPAATARLPRPRPAAAKTAALQTGTGTISGSIKDQLDAVLPAVEVSLTNTATGERRQLPTDGLGEFTFADVPAGRYILASSLPGFRMFRVSIDLGEGDAKRLPIPMVIGTIQETINVVDDGVVPPTGPARPRTPIAQRPPAAAAGTVRVGGNIRPPRKLRDVAPGYPSAAASAGIQGVVTLAGIIGSDGFMKDVRVLSSPNGDLAQASIDAVRQWEFDPTLLDGMPMDTLMEVTVSFRAAR
jgi:TonB family protein